MERVHAHGLEELSVKMSTVPKAIYIFNAIPNKILKAFFYKTRKINPKIHMVAERTLTRQSNLE